MRRSSLITALPVAALLLASCTSLKENNDPPAGLSCGTIANGGGDAQSLTTTLSKAQPGTCVLLATQTYSGNFTVPAGVMLASAEGSRATITGTQQGSPAIAVAGGAGSGVWGVDVKGSMDVGIAVRGGAVITSVNVSGAKSAGIAALCTDATTCHDGAHALELDDVHVTANDTGLWTNGEDITMTGGESSQNTSQSLTGGNGIIAFGGAHVTLNTTTVSNNDQVGFLIDGAGGTTSDLKSVTVSQNGARGIWAQGLTGSLTSPSLTIEGTSLISGNKIVGLGGTESHGIIFVGGKIEGTVAAPIATDVGTQEQVGDGFGMFSNSGDVKLDTVEVSGSARAAGLLDTTTGVIIFVGGTVAAGPSNLKIVVQNTDAADVALQQLPAGSTTTPSAPLGVSAPKIAVGALIQ